MKRSFPQGQASKKVSSSSCAESKKILGVKIGCFLLVAENSDSYFLRDRVGFGFGCSSGSC